MNENEVIDLFERNPRSAHVYMLKNRGYHSYDVAMAAVKASGLNLRWVRPEIVDPELCKAALADDYRASLYVPRDLRTAGTMNAAADRFRQINASQLLNGSRSSASFRFCCMSLMK